MVAVLVGAAAVTVAAEQLFRVWYFGEALPNTYYLKLTGHPLGVRLKTGIAAYGEWVSAGSWSLFLLVAYGEVRSRVLRTPQALMLVGVFIAQSAYSIYVGGDAWELFRYANRYVSMALPCLILVAAKGAEQLTTDVWRGLRTVLRLGSEQRLSRIGPFFVGLLVCVFVAWIPSNRKDFIRWQEKGIRHLENDHEMVRLGLELRRSTPPETVIAVVWAGAVPYFSHRQAVDLLGKNDPTIARMHSRSEKFYPGHTKWNYEYSLGELAPDLIVQLWEVDAGDRKLIERLGYRPAPEGLGLFAAPDLYAWFEASSRYAHEAAE